MAEKPKKKPAHDPKIAKEAKSEGESYAKESKEHRQPGGDIPDPVEDPIGHAKHHLSAQEGDGHGVRVNVGAGSTVHVHAPVSPGESQVAPNPGPAMGMQSPVMAQPTMPGSYNPVQDHHDKLHKKSKKGTASNPKGTTGVGAGGL